MPDQSFTDRVFQKFCHHPGKGEITVYCRDRYARAEVLRILMANGYDINQDGVDRTFHLQPDSPMCNFTYPNVYFTKESCGCTCRSPDPDWPTAEEFIAFAGQYEQGSTNLQPPDLPWLS